MRETVLPLNELDDFEVADGDADPRGWEVVTADGVHVGQVHELLVAPDLEKVRFLECELDRAELGLSEERHVLLPVEEVGLDRDDRQVLIGRLSRDEVLGLAPYRGLTVGEDIEESVRRSFSGRARGEEIVEERRVVREDELGGPDREIVVRRRVE